MNTRLVAASLAALVFAAVPSTADACWDGTAITTENVSLSIAGDDTWSPEEARRWAKWAGRIDALVPAGKSLNVMFGEIEICDDATGECAMSSRTWDDSDPFTLFEVVADEVGASRKQIAVARRAAIEPLTVQVAATHDLAAAEKMATRIDDAGLELSGFWYAGPFPGVSSSAHVVESTNADGVTTYNIVVGAFLQRAHADEAVAVLGSELGMSGFVRALDQSSVTYEEGC